MYVCICNEVTDSDIKRAVDGGVCSMRELCQQLNVATCCGNCAKCAKTILNDAVQGKK